MPVLLSIPAIISAIIAFLARKVGSATAAIASMLFLTAAMIACINTIIQTVLSILAVPAWLANPIGMFIPSDFTAVLSAIVSSRVCRAAYDLAMDKVRVINAAN